jgi:hypothetical protein
MAVLDQIESRQAKRKYRYAVLLNLAKHSEAEESELAELADALRKSPEKVQADLGIVAKARKLQEQINQGTGIDNERAAAIKSLRVFDAETDRLEQQLVARQEERFVLLGEEERIYRAISQAQRSTRELSFLRQQNADLLV